MTPNSVASMLKSVPRPPNASGVDEPPSPSFSARSAMSSQFGGRSVRGTSEVRGARHFGQDFGELWLREVRPRRPPLTALVLCVWAPHANGRARP